jgi:hypothetical protein
MCRTRVHSMSSPQEARGLLSENIRRKCMVLLIRAHHRPMCTYQSKRNESGPINLCLSSTLMAASHPQRTFERFFPFRFRAKIAYKFPICPKVHPAFISSSVIWSSFISETGHYTHRPILKSFKTERAIFFWIFPGLSVL